MAYIGSPAAPTIATVSDDTITSAKIDSTSTGMTFADLTVDTNTLVVDETNNRVGIGTSSPLTELVTVGTTMATSQAFVGSVADTTYSGGIINLSNSSRSIGITSDPTNAGAGSILNFSVDGSERMRINSSGNVGIGLTSPSETLHVSGTIGTEDQFIADSAFVASTPGYSFRGDTDTGIFRATANEIGVSTGGTERMRIDNSGNVGIGTTNPAYRFEVSGSSMASSFSGSGSFSHILFRNTNGTIGSISSAGTSTAYNTSSDYRLKENVVEVTDGIDRVKLLKPSRFNFIVDPDKTVDGFLAHEVSDIVPEAITGTKDEVDDEGNPEYQGIDQSKLVPLLTAALQESIAKIEALEARVSTLESA